MPAHGTFTYGGGTYANPPVSNSPKVETAGGQFPTRIIEAAFGYGPNDTNPVWVNITNDVTQFSTRRGRQTTLSRFEAGQATITLDNKSGKYSPFNSSGPYYGNIRPGLPIRIRALWGTVTYPRFYGYVDTWPLTWPAANDSTVTVTAVDSMKFLNLKKPTSIAAYAPVIQADAPVAWWRFNDPAGSTTFADATGHGHTGTILAGPLQVNNGPSTFTYRFQSEPLLVADTTASLYLGINEIVGNASVGSFTATNNWSWEAWVQLAETQGNTAYFLEAQVAATTEFAMKYDGTHAVMVGPLAGGAATVTGPALTAGQTYHLAGTYSTAGNGNFSFYVNGVFQGSTNNTSAGWAGSIGSIFVGGTLGISLPNSSSNGWIQDAAFYNYTLSAAQVLNHYNAGTLPRQLETTGQRISYLASYTNIPASMQVIDTGLTTVQAATGDWLKNTILKSMQDQADTEGGDLFIDAAGKLTFFNRNHTSRSPYSGVSLVLGDSGTAAEEPYRLNGLAVPYDDQNVWNEVVATAPNFAPQTASDATSQQQYGIRTQSLSVQSSTPQDALNHATFNLNIYKSSQPRIDSITVDPTDDPTMLFGPVLGFDLLTRIELRRRPMDGTGSLFDQICLIEGIEDKVTKATWETTWRLSAVDAIEVWTIEDPMSGRIVDGSSQNPPVVIGF